MSTRESSIGLRLSRDRWFAYNTLIPVLRYFELQDLLKFAQVCKLWHTIASDENVWHAISVETCEKHLPLVADKFGDRIRNIRVYHSSNGLVATSLRKMNKLRKVVVEYNVLENFEELLDTLKSTNITKLEIYDFGDKQYSLYFILSKFPNLTSFGICTSNLIEPDTFGALKLLKNLTHLFLYDTNCCFPFKEIAELTPLKFLYLGGMHCSGCCSGQLLSIDRILNNLKNLSKIYLSIFLLSARLIKALSRVPHLRDLKLHFHLHSDNEDDFIQSLSLCKNLKVLTVTYMNVHANFSDMAKQNAILLEAVLTLKSSLTHLYWVTLNAFIKKIESAYGVGNSIAFERCILSPNSHRGLVTIMPLEDFRKNLGDAMGTTQVFVLVEEPNFRNCLQCAPKNE